MKTNSTLKITIAEKTFEVPVILELNQKQCEHLAKEIFEAEGDELTKGEFSEALVEYVDVALAEASVMTQLPDIKEAWTAYCEMASRDDATQEYGTEDGSQD